MQRSLRRKTMKTKTASSKKHLSAVVWWRKATGFSRLEVCVIILVLLFSVCTIIVASETLEANAQAILCQSRLGQLSRALFDYTADYDGYIMPAALKYEKDGKTEVPYYHYSDPNLWPPEGEYWYLNLYAHKYLPNKDAFFCPDAFPQNFNQFEEYYKAEKAANRPVKRFDEGEGFILGMRDWSYKNSTCYKAPKRLTSIPQPAQFFLVADSINGDYRTSKPVQFHRIMMRERAKRETMGDGRADHIIGISARHNNKVSTLFADGHVKLTKMKYFLDIQGQGQTFSQLNWQVPYSKPWSGSDLAVLSGYRVYDKRNNEWTCSPTTPGEYRGGGGISPDPY